MSFLSKMDITTLGLVGPLQAALERNLSAIAPHGFEIRANPQGGHNLLLNAPDEAASADLIKNFLAIAALANNLMPLNCIGIQGHCPFIVSMARLKLVFPNSTLCVGGALDLSLEIESSGEYRLLRESFLQELPTKSSLFLLNREGVYCDINLSENADPPCGPVEMMGKSVGQMIGEQAHDLVTAALRLALRDGVSGAIAYSGVVKGETRHYTAKIRPIQFMGRALIAVDRVQ